MGRKRNRSQTAILGRWTIAFGSDDRPPRRTRTTVTQCVTRTMDDESVRLRRCRVIFVRRPSEAVVRALCADFLAKRSSESHNVRRSYDFTRKEKQQ